MKLSTLAREIARELDRWNEQRRVYEKDLIKAFKAFGNGVDPDDLFDDSDDFTSKYLDPDFYQHCQDGTYSLDDSTGFVWDNDNGCDLMQTVLDNSDQEDRTLDFLVSEYFNYFVRDDLFDDLVAAIESDLNDLAVDLHQELDDPDARLDDCKAFLANYIWLDDLLLYTQRDLSGADLVDAFLRQ